MKDVTRNFKLSTSQFCERECRGWLLDSHMMWWIMVICIDLVKYGYGIYWRCAFGNQSIQGCSSKESRNSIICPKQDGAFPLMLRFWTLKKCFFAKEDWHSQPCWYLGICSWAWHGVVILTGSGETSDLVQGLWGMNWVGQLMSRSIDQGLLSFSLHET